MILGDSIFQTASMVRWVSVDIPTHHTMFDPQPQADPRHRFHAAYCSPAKSDGSYTWRISVSPSPATSRKRLTCLIASSLDSVRSKAKPAISSLDSVNGPSFTVYFPAERRTRDPFALGRHPSVASNVPDLKLSSTNAPILVISSCVGGVPSGLLGLYIHKNFITKAPSYLSWKRASRCDVEPRVKPRSINASNGNR